MSALVLFLAVQMSIAPANPKVGDPVTIALLDSGRIESVADGGCAEVITKSPRAIVVRSFAVGPCSVRFTRADEPGVTHEVSFTIQSVLSEEDPEPSPYRPPIRVPMDPRAWWSIGLAAAVAVLAWSLVLLRGGPEKSTSGPSAPLLQPIEELVATMKHIQGKSGPAEQIAAADALRRYFHRTERALSRDRTTGEIVTWLSRRRDARATIVAAILRAGDRAKFAPGESLDPLVSADSLRTFIEMEATRGSRE